MGVSSPPPTSPCSALDRGATVDGAHHRPLDPRCPSDKEMVHVARLCAPLDEFPLLCASGRTNSMHADIVSSRRAMLRYYTVSFAFMLTTNLENNCFLSGRPPCNTVRAP